VRGAEGAESTSPQGAGGRPSRPGADPQERNEPRNALSECVVARRYRVIEALALVRGVSGRHTRGTDPHSRRANPRPGYRDSRIAGSRAVIDARAGRHRVHQPREPQVTAMPPPDLTALIAAAKTGDADAFADLYEMHLSVVRRVVYARMRHVARRDADDLISETFTRAWANMPQFTWQGSGFAAWLTRIATNLIRDWHKRPHARVTEPCGDFADVDSPDLISRVPGPLNRLCLESDLARLRTAMTDLTEAQKECVDLRIYRGCSIKETAAVMGLTDVAVKALLHRGVLALRRSFEQDESSSASDPARHCAGPYSKVSPTDATQSPWSGFEVVPVEAPCTSGTFSNARPGEPSAGAARHPAGST